MTLMASLPCPDSPINVDRFDVDRAFDHVEALSYPRRAGTVRERRAARYILRRFSDLGFERARESFPVALTGPEIGRSLTFAGCAILVLAGAILAKQHPIGAAMAWTVAAWMVHSPWRLNQALCGCWPTGLTSRNLLARRRESARSKIGARVVFMAHYDSKSQILPTGARVALVLAATAGSLTLAGLAMIAALGEPGLLAISPWKPIAWIIAGLLAILAANRIGDRSPGVIDNGSGVGTLLELARTWRPRPEAPVEAVWIATGSEEIGLEGARDVLDRHAEWWREVPTLLINLESVGAGDRVFLAGESGALALAEQVADGLAIPRARLRILGAGMDHIPFAARGLPAVSIMGDVVRSSFAFHSRRDGLDLLRRPALERAGDLAAGLAWAWADRHRPSNPESARSGEEDPKTCATANSLDG